jgi:uncharacterized protein
VIERRVVYLDSSAIVKLIVSERGSKELRAYLRPRPSRIASRIVDVEVRRAASRVAGLDVEERLHEVLARLARVELDEELAAVAGRLTPTGLRTLDAIHLASAMAIGGQLEAIVTYDQRLADAAAWLGIAVVSPGTLSRGRWLHGPAPSDQPGQVIWSSYDHRNRDRAPA